VDTERKGCVIGYVSIINLRRDSMRLSLFKEYKVAATRHVQSSARTKSCVGICCKECIDLEFD
jgi:hypothetical protein